MKTIYFILFLLLASIVACEEESVYCWECDYTVITEYGVQTGLHSFYLGSDTLNTSDTVCGYSEDMIQSYMQYMSRNDTLKYSTVTRNVKCKKL